MLLARVGAGHDEEAMGRDEEGEGVERGRRDVLAGYSARSCVVEVEVAAGGPGDASIGKCCRSRTSITQSRDLESESQSKT